MRKQKMRGFGFGPEKHQDEALKAARLASEEFRRVTTSAKSGQCSLALAQLGHAREMVGVAYAESYAGSGGKRRMTGEDFPAWDPALSAFRSNCLVGGGLSGMHRRRRR
jgi:hypothetical protein